MSRPDIGPEEIAAVTDVLRSGKLAAGRRVEELEERWAAYVGTKHAIAVCNGTVAEMCIYAGLGLGPGDEVITVAHTFGATVSAIMSTVSRPARRPRAKLRVAKRQALIERQASSTMSPVRRRAPVYTAAGESARSPRTEKLLVCDDFGDRERR